MRARPHRGPCARPPPQTRTPRQRMGHPPRLRHRHPLHLLPPAHPRPAPPARPGRLPPPGAHASAPWHRLCAHCQLSNPSLLLRTTLLLRHLLRPGLLRGDACTPSAARTSIPWLCLSSQPVWSRLNQTKRHVLQGLGLYVLSFSFLHASCLSAAFACMSRLHPRGGAHSDQPISQPRACTIMTVSEQKSTSCYSIAHEEWPHMGIATRCNADHATGPHEQYQPDIISIKPLIMAKSPLRLATGQRICSQHRSPHVD